MERFDGMWWSERNGVLELRAKSLCKREREEGLVKKEREREGGERTGYTGGTE